ncbi:MAG: hypothetical protein QG586_1735, partial [Pseudomonadota bacterium]|nr:hypothetical protein [Pseudomonadota bacterium]
EPRSLALGQSPDAAPRATGLPSPTVTESQLPTPAERAQGQADSPPREPSVVKTPRRRKDNGNASAPAGLPDEHQWA